MELALVQQAAGGDLPTLGVCLGAQLINVALGGTLVEHLPDESDNTIAEQGRTRAGDVPHPVTIAPSSQLAAVIGEQVVVGASWHHQAIRTPAPGLEVVAQAADGTIEAVELPGHPWLLAVQWHRRLRRGKTRSSSGCLTRWWRRQGRGCGRGKVVFCAQAPTQASAMPVLQVGAVGRRFPGEWGCRYTAGYEY